MVAVKLPDGFGPADARFTIRVPMGSGPVEVRFSIDDRPSTALEIDVPERILGVDRDVWECFSDTSNRGTLWEDEGGIGCAAWASEKLVKWDQDGPCKGLGHWDRQLGRGIQGSAG